MKQLLLISVFLLLFVGCTNEQVARTDEALGQKEDATEIRARSPQTEYRNPVDGKTYTAPGGWKEYHPQTERTDTKKRIQTRNVRLLTSATDTSDRTTVESLADFIERIEISAQNTLASCEEEAVVMVQFTCSPGNFSVELAHEGDLSNDLLQEYYDDLVKLESLPVSNGEVAFQVTINIKKAGR